MYSIIAATYKKNRISNKRAFPWTLIISRLIGGFFAIIFPYFIYTFFLKGSLNESFYQYTNTADYITFVVLGTAFFILGRSTLMEVGRAFILELREGTLESFLITSASRMGYYIGCLLEQLGRGLLQLAVILFFGILFGANILSVFTLQSLVVVVLSIFSFFSLALTLSSIMLFTRDTYITQNTLFTFMSFVSGVAFPTEYLPLWLQYLSHLFPLTAALKLFRLVVISGQSMLIHLDVVLELVVLSVLYILIGIFWLRKIEKKLIESIFG